MHWGYYRAPAAAARVFEYIVFKALLYSCLPAPMRIQGKSYFRNLLLDWRDSSAGESDRSVPPRHLNISGDGPFRELGEHNLRLCRELGGLQRDAAVLDLGCGTGRTALAMSGYLTASASYVGLDIIAFAIRWCRQHSGQYHPNFRFINADLFNKAYNPGGKIASENFTLPFADRSFNFVLANSLFTHVLPQTMERYISEVRRVLKPDGRFLSTWFLLDERERRVLRVGTSALYFKHHFAHHAQSSLHAPEQAVAFRRAYLERALAESRFTVDRICRGGWYGSEAEVDSGQDVIVASANRNSADAML